MPQEGLNRVVARWNTLLEYTITPDTPQHAATMYASRFSPTAFPRLTSTVAVSSRARRHVQLFPRLTSTVAGIVSRASPRRGGISGVTSAHLNVHRPSGGDDAMDRVQISDPDPFSAKASDYMSTPAAFVTPELELGDPIVKEASAYHTLAFRCSTNRRHVVGSALAQGHIGRRSAREESSVARRHEQTSPRRDERCESRPSLG